jgi:hypothetical protein
MLANLTCINIYRYELLLTYKAYPLKYILELLNSYPCISLLPRLHFSGRKNPLFDYFGSLLDHYINDRVQK